MAILRTRPGAAATLAAAALALAGCGDGVDDDAHVQARGAVQAFLRLCAEQRGSDVALVLNDPALDAVMRSGGVRRGCALILRRPGVLPPAAYAAARITGLASVGDRATVAIALPGGTRTTVEVEREGDRWWVTNERLGP